jgi:hypothetical protein
LILGANPRYEIREGCSPHRRNRDLALNI